ncbi:hypothetical protein BD311DRAFT_659213 [Dichomitus squalens]|uniref:Uncharacterized protein n=1 Tax=Dichomitus squalens TaxID=114155 RepID=A0A4Q9MSQ9_9APHY|nr:hypothetical protein BD311DRAFT_659213 [Dichomitus squalens]
MAGYGYGYSQAIARPRLMHSRPRLRPRQRPCAGEKKVFQARVVVVGHGYGRTATSALVFPALSYIPPPVISSSPPLLLDTHRHVCDAGQAGGDVQTRTLRLGGPLFSETGITWL